MGGGWQGGEAYCRPKSFNTAEMLQILNLSPIPKYPCSNSDQLKLRMLYIIFQISLYSSTKISALILPNIIK